MIQNPNICNSPIAMQKLRSWSGRVFLERYYQRVRKRDFQLISELNRLCRIGFREPKPASGVVVSSSDFYLCFLKA